MEKINVVVLMGGKSSEYDVSIVSGMEVIKQLDSEKYNVFPLKIDRSGIFSLRINGQSNNILTSKHDDANQNKAVIASLEKSFPRELLEGETIVFIAMHGRYGEDGSVQGMLELSGLRYTGSGVLASSIGMDKEIFRKLISAEGVKVPVYFVMKKGDRLTNKINYPVFVKPVNGGSSIGCSIAKNFKEYRVAVNRAFKFDDRVMVDEYIRGREVTCAVLGTNKPFALPVVEIKPLKNNFFDYESKYTESGAEEIVPAKLSKSLTKIIQEEALKIYKLLGVKGFGRIDFLIKNSVTPVALEINTIPGLTPTSLLPKAAKAYGLSYGQLLDKIISYARE